MEPTCEAVKSMDTIDVTCVQVTGTVVELFTPCKAHVLQSQHLGHHRFPVLVTRVMILLQLILVVRQCVTQTVHMCGLQSKEDNATCCPTSQTCLKTVVLMLLQQGTIRLCSRNPTGSMITLDIITTLLCLILNLRHQHTIDLLYSNSINCSISVIVTFTLCCTFSLFHSYYLS